MFDEGVSLGCGTNDTIGGQLAHGDDQPRHIPKL